MSKNSNIFVLFIFFIYSCLSKLKFNHLFILYNRTILE